MTMSGNRVLLLLGLLVLLQGCSGRGEISQEKREDAAQYNAQLGAQYLQRGELDQSREKLLKALEQDQNNALAHVTYARLQDHVGETDSADDHFRQALELAPDEAEYRNSYGVYLCGNEQYDAAIAEFQSAAENPYYRTPEFALDNAGLCMLDASRLEDAEVYLRDALRVNPRFARAYLHMAELLYRQDRNSIADAYLQRHNAYGAESAESLWLGLRIKRENDDLAGAQDLAGRLLNQFPSSAQAAEYLSRPIQ